jgi:hypothetical protein
LISTSSYRRKPVSIWVFFGGKILDSGLRRNDGITNRCCFVRWLRADIEPAGSDPSAKIRLLPQPVQILLNLIALDLLLQRADLLLALKIIYLLLLAQRIFFLFDALDLLVGLQALQLLVVP